MTIEILPAASSEINAPRRLARQVIYENPWVSLYADRVQSPGGRIIERHHIVHFETESVAVLMENEQGELLLIESYRYATGTIEWETPAGKIDPGESILEGARREAYEESGYETVDHCHLYRFYALIGISNMVHHIVYCRATQQVAEFDRNEVRSTRWFSKPAIEAMIERREIGDGYTLTGLLLWLRRV